MKALSRMTEAIAPSISIKSEIGGNRAVDLALDGLILQLQIRKRHRHLRLPYLSASSRRAGLPAKVPDVVMSLVTTDPAPITTSSVIRTGMIVALDPIETRLPITVSRHNPLLPRAGPPVEKVSFTNITP